MVANKQVIFSQIPEGYPVADKDITIKNSTIDLDAELPNGDFILKNLVLSVDPYMRGRMRDASIKSYAPAFPLGETMTGDTMSVVLKSNNPEYKVGDLVYGRTAQGLFEEYSQVSADYAKHAYVVRNDAKENGLPLSHYVGGNHEK
jgi:NADPH-dependent curcumin reductase CurA